MKWHTRWVPSPNVANRYTSPKRSCYRNRLQYLSSNLMRFLRLLTVLTIASAAFGGEFAVLTNGSRLRIDRHEVDGERIRLYTGSGHIEMDAAGIQAFEIE